MKIELKNIGAIDHAEIDLSQNLILLCGPNNTGKTYVANTIYATYKYSKDRTFDFDADAEIAKKIKSSIFEGKTELVIEKNLVSRVIKEKIDKISDYLPNIFDTTADFFPESKIKITISDEEIEEKIDKLRVQARVNFGTVSIDIKKNINTKNFQLNFSKETAVNNINEFKIHKRLSTQKISANSLNEDYIPNRLSASVLTYLFRPFFNNTYITTAERTAINIFSKELSSRKSEALDNLIDYTNNDDESRNNPLDFTRRYPLPIRDSLKIAEDLSNLQKTISDYSFLADEIENDILKGKIEISTTGDLLFNPGKNNVKALNIHQSGSVVKSLSNLVFYFRHLAELNDFIIIDEPELNLHPDNQIIIARLMARIVNNGFKVLISTHSDYIITEINNLIRLNSGGDSSKSLMDKYGYNQSDLINKDMVGVYLFKDNKAATIAVDEFGFEISTIQKENSRLAEISESIYFDLFDKQNWFEMLDKIKSVIFNGYFVNKGTKHFILEETGKEASCKEAHFEAKNDYLIYKFDQSIIRDSQEMKYLFPYYTDGNANAMCDYIIFYKNSAGKLFSVVCNLKSKNRSNNIDQINAGVIFSQFIFDTAKRLHPESFMHNGKLHFVKVLFSSKELYKKSNNRSGSTPIINLISNNEIKEKLILENKCRVTN